MKNLFIRSLSGIVYISLIIGSLIINRYLFSLVIVLFSQVGLYEFSRFGHRKNADILYQFTGFCLFLITHLIFSEIISIKWMSVLFILPLLLMGVEIFKKGKWDISNLSNRVIGYIYVLLPLILLNYLNLKSGSTYSRLVLSVFILIWVNDSFAYLTGMMFGRHKLFERITPKKTWEGFAGGIIATITAAWFLRTFIGAESILQWELAALFIAIAAVFGDFVESFFKRQAGVKDSGKIMPGHGGILDRIDSILFVFPVVFIYFELVS